MREVTPRVISQDDVAVHVAAGRMSPLSALATVVLRMCGKIARVQEVDVVCEVQWYGGARDRLLPSVSHHH